MNAYIDMHGEVIGGDDDEEDEGAAVVSDHTGESSDDESYDESEYESDGIDDTIVSVKRRRVSE